MISMAGLPLPQSWPQFFAGLKGLCLLGFCGAISAVTGRTMPEHYDWSRGLSVDLVPPTFLLFSGVVQKEVHRRRRDRG